MPQPMALTKSNSPPMRRRLEERGQTSTLESNYQQSRMKKGMGLSFKNMHAYCEAEGGKTANFS